MVLWLLLSPWLLKSQPPLGKWTDYFALNDVHTLAISEPEVLCAANNGFFSYNISKGELIKQTKVHGLSDVDITAIGRIPDLDIVVLGYRSGEVNLVYRQTKRVVSIPYIKDKPMSGSKCINHFLVYGSMLYAATDFGVVLIDPKKLEIRDTYFIVENSGSLKAKRIAIWNNRFWVASNLGLYSADVNDPLLISYQRWSKETFFTSPISECLSVTATKQQIFAVEKIAGNDIIWTNSGNGWVEVDRPFDDIIGVSAAHGKFVAFNRQGIQCYTYHGVKVASLVSYSFGGVPRINDCIPLDADRLAIADSFHGLVMGTVVSQTAYAPNGPFNNKFFQVEASSDYVVAASGAYDATFGNLWYPFITHIYSAGRWSYFADWFIPDAVRVKFDPRNASRFVVASWGGGLYRFEGSEMVAHYTPVNSSLQSVFPGQPYCRIAGMDFDGKGNLWVANSEVANPISVLTAQGNWFSFPYAGAIGTGRIISVTTSSGGNIWLALARDNGLFVLNPGVSIESANDDIYLKFRPRDVNGNTLSNEVTALTFDRDGYLWLGTNQGVLVSYNPHRVLQGETRFQKIKIPDVVPGLAVYLLETEEITCIDIDGGNRKWFGTAKSGVFLFSADGTKELHHFNTANSPLPSNTILSVKTHPVTGEVFIATDKGLVSFRSDANEPSDSFGKVYAFPNPVRPNYTGVITITGLMDNSVVKITDVAGNLVYETRSNGGMATWSGRNRNGSRVSTGVYLVFCSDSRGQQTTVTKILFVK